MSKTILAPKFPAKASDATLRRWLRDAGQPIAKGEALVELETTTQLVRLEAAASGRIVRTMAKAGETLRTDAPLAEFEEGDFGEAERPSPEPEKPTPAPDTKKTDKKESQMAEPVGDVTVVAMPKAGNDMEEGTVLKWLVAEGDAVEKGQVLFELETDKATMEIESEAAGTVQKIVVAEGEMVAIHTPLAYIADSADAVEQAIAATASGTQEVEKAEAQAAAPALAPKKKVASAPAATDASGRVKASPAARRAAQERGIDLASVATGSGPGGRIITDDLEGVAASATPVAASAAASGEVARAKMTGMRRAIARNLTNSFQNIPHYYMKMTVEAEALMSAYREQKKVCKARLNDLLMLAVGRTMAEFPEFRSRIEGEEVARYPHANVGMAVALEDGLVVPVVLGVDTMSLAELAASSREAIDKARAGKPQNMGQGHFTISNLGMTDIEEFTAIINPPEAAILAVGKVVEAVQVEKGAMRPTKQMTMWMSSDHRLIDGMLAAKFLGRLKRFLEKPGDLV